MAIKKSKKSISFFNSVHFKIPLMFILLLLLTLQIVGAYFIRQLETEMVTSFDSQMELQVGYLKETVQPILQDEDLNTAERTAQLNTAIRRFSSSELIEIQVLDENGFLLATTNPTNQAHIGQRSTDADVEQARFTATRTEVEMVDSNQDGRIKKYVEPVFQINSTNNMVGLVNATVNLESVYDQVQQIVFIYISSSALSLLFAVILAFLTSRGITRPLQAMKDQTEQIAEGNYSGEVQVLSNDEIGQLAHTINNLSVRVKEAQISTESERQRLDSILKHMTDGVIATDRRGKIVIINSRALDFLNLTQEEVLGRSIMEVLDLRDKFTFRELFETQEELKMDFSTPDQETVIKGEFSVIQRDSGFVSGLVWVLTDVTKHEKIERDRRQFVSNVSHELRTPLTSVRSYTEALADGAIEDKELAMEFLGVIQTETDRMIRMISDLLSLSKMDSGMEENEKELVLFNDFVNHILDRFEMMLNSEENDDKDYRIRREITDEALWVEINQDKMMQVIDNIMNNAIKYSPDGGIITVRLMSTHNELILSIQDQGLGIPQKAVPHVFDRFYRVDKARSREQGGTGLGLAISKEVVELHNGKIWVNSIENKGSTFFISLPYEEMIGEDVWED